MLGTMTKILNHPRPCENTKMPKMFLQRVAFQIGLKTFFIKKVRNTTPWTCVTSDLNGEEIFRKFCEKELQRTSQKN